MAWLHGIYMAFIHCLLPETEVSVLQHDCGSVLHHHHLPHQAVTTDWGCDAASILLWTLGYRWQHVSQGLSVIVTQISCRYANMTISQSFYFIVNSTTLLCTAMGCT